MTSATDELKSCPFCGCEASWIAARQREDGTYYPAACGCSKCGIRCYGESDYGHGGFATEEDRKVSMEQAVLKWNTRTSEQAIAATLGEGYEGAGDRLHESYGKVPEQGERENDSERESCGEVCGDDRFELIGKAKRKLLECTNIEMRPDEMAVIDSILFRCWQMGWLDQLRDENTRWHDLFGTPEIAADTLMDMCQSMGDCGHCPLYLSGLAFCDNGDYEGDVLEWLESEVRDD